MKRLILFCLLLLCLAVSSFGQQISFNPRGAWQSGTLYTYGDTFTCSANLYHVSKTMVSGASCLLTNAGTADLCLLNYTGIGTIPDERPGVSYCRLVNNFYYISQHMFDKATYNDLTLISTPSAPASGFLRFYGKGNALCWIPSGGSETCTTSVTAGGDVSGPVSNLSVDKIKGRAVANTTPTDLQYFGWNNASSQWEPKTLPSVLNIGGSSGDLQYNNGGSLGGSFLKQDANGPYSSRALHAAASPVSSSATPTYDVALGNRLEHTLTNNVTSSTWSHLRGGAKYSVVLTQDGTGNKSHTWPVGTLNACSPWLVANSITTVDFEVASDASTVTAKNCSVYDPANPGVVFYGLMRGSIPTPAAGNLACGFDSASTTWKCIAPDGSVSTAVKSLAAVTHNFLTALSTGGVLSAAQPASSDLSDYSTVNIRSFGVTIDGSSQALTSGQVGYVTIPHACTIIGWSVQGDQSGSISIDIDKHAAAIPNTTTDKISASAPLSLSSAQLAQSTTLTGWTTSVAANDVIGFNVTSVSNLTRATAVVNCRI